MTTPSRQLCAGGWGLGSPGEALTEAKVPQGRVPAKPLELAGGFFGFGGGAGRGELFCFLGSLQHRPYIANQLPLRYELSQKGAELELTPRLTILKVIMGTRS